MQIGRVTLVYINLFYKKLIRQCYCMLMMSTIIVICNFILIISIINCFEKGKENNFSFLRIVQIIIPLQAQSTQQQILEGLSANPEPLWGQFHLHGHRLDANS